MSGQYGTPFRETEALLAAQQGDEDALSEITSEMLRSELESLCEAADEVAAQCRWAIRHGAHRSES